MLVRNRKFATVDNTGQQDHTVSKKQDKIGRDLTHLQTARSVLLPKN